MANKRDFKKYATAVGASMCEDIMICYYNVAGIDKAVAEQAIGKVLHAVEQAVANSNIFFDKGRKAFESAEAYGKAKRAFFKQMFAKLNADFEAALNDALKDFNAAVPQAVKDSNKEAAK